MVLSLFMNERMRETNNTRIKNPSLARIVADKELVKNYEKIIQEARKRQLTDIASFALEKVSQIDTSLFEEQPTLVLTDVNHEEFKAACASFNFTPEQISHAWNVAWSASIAGMNTTIVGWRDQNDVFVPLPINSVKEPYEGIFVIQEDRAAILDVASLRDCIVEAKETPKKRAKNVFGPKATPDDLEILTRFVDSYAPSIS